MSSKPPVDRRELLIAAAKTAIKTGLLTDMIEMDTNSASIVFGLDNGPVNGLFELMKDKTLPTAFIASTQNDTCMEVMVFTRVPFSRSYPEINSHCSCIDFIRFIGQAKEVSYGDDAWNIEYKGRIGITGLTDDD